jgi:hypothetical protein
MPPKAPKAVTLPVCPDHVFAVSSEFAITGREKISTTLSQCVQQWVKGGQALIRLGDESGWWRATKVQENDSGTFSVRVAKTAEGKNGRWILERKLIKGIQGGEKRPDFICFGFFSGEFESPSGLKAKVLDADLDSSPETVSFTTNFDDGENEVGQEMNLSQFLVDFPPLEVEDTVEWDFSNTAENNSSTTVFDMGDAPLLSDLLSTVYYGPSRKNAFIESLGASELRVALLGILGDKATIGDSDRALRAALERVETILRQTDKRLWEECRKDLIRLASAVAAGKGDFKTTGDIVRSVVFDKLTAADEDDQTRPRRTQSASQSAPNDTCHDSHSSHNQGVQDAPPSDPEDSEDDDSEESSVHEPPPKRVRKQQASARSRPYSTPRVRFAEDDEEERQAVVDGGYSPQRKLLAITPRGADLMQAAAHFFSEPRLCAAAQIDRVVPSEIELADVQRMVVRCSMALDRLESLSHVGAFLPAVKPSSLDAVAMLAETILDRLLRPAAPTPPAGDAITHPTLQGQVDGDEEGQGSGKRSEGLEGAKLRKSVPFAVAANLQRAQVQLGIASNRGGSDVAAGIRHSPAELRLDLQRTVMSKCCVHGPGMLLSQLWLPPTVHSWKTKLEYQVAQELRSIANGDQTQRWQLDAATARKLAANVVEGDVSLAELIRTNKDMRGAGAPKADSLEELNQAWRLADLGFSRLTEIVMGHRDPGIKAITETLDTSARSQELLARDCKEWLKLVLSSYEEALVSFRSGDTDIPPDFSTAVRANSRHLQFSCFVAAAAKAIPQMTPAKKESGKLDDLQPPNLKKARLQQHKESLKAQKAARDKIAAEKEKQAADARKTGKGKSDAWPDRPDFTGKRWQELQTDVRKSFPQTCSFFLLSRCKNDAATCARKHEIPDGFEAFKANNAE